MSDIQSTQQGTEYVGDYGVPVDPMELIGYCDGCE